MHGENFTQFIAIVDNANSKKDKIKALNVLSAQNVVYDYNARTDETFFIRCRIHHKAKIGSMDFKDYEINTLDKNSPYDDKSYNKEMLSIDYQDVMANILNGYSPRIKGWVIKTEKNENAKGIPLGATIITIDILGIDFFKKDKSLENLSNAEILNKFYEDQEEFLSEEEIKQFNK